MINNEELINKVKSYNKFLNHDTLSKAYDFALNAHNALNKFNFDRIEKDFENELLNL